MSTSTERLVRLTSFPTEIGAASVVAALEEAGIRAIATGDITAGFRAEAPGWVQVMVAEEDQERAQHVLESTQTEMMSVDWSTVDVGEPEDTDRNEVSEAAPSKHGFYGMPVWQMVALVMVSMAIAGYVFHLLGLLAGAFK